MLNLDLETVIQDFDHGTIVGAKFTQGGFV
jgi:hypothetical protein